MGTVYWTMRWLFQLHHDVWLWVFNRLCLYRRAGGFVCFGNIFMPFSMAAD
jgi:hypothetical protein